MDLKTMESPFKHMLHTNTVPDDAECQQIRDFLVEPRKEVAHLAEQIARTQRLLDDLRRERDDLTEFIDAHLALVSPARRLPDDVVREIFVASLPANRNCAISVKESPLLLCRICQSWRHLALSTPQMWASVHIVAPSNDEMERMVDTLFPGRDGQFPMPRHCLWPSFVTSLRWKHIRFILPPDQFEPLSSISPQDVPMLEKATVDGFGNLDVDHTIMGSRFAFLRTTSLWSASLNARFVFPETPIRLEFLRHLSFKIIEGAPESSVTAQSTLEILRRCTLLESCTIDILGDLNGPSNLPCRMEHLRSVCVSSFGPDGFDYGGATHFFETLVLPNLRCLEYTGRPALHFLPLLTYARSVECLILHTAASTTALLKVLRLTPMLEELRISGDPTMHPFKRDGQFIPLLTPQAQSDVVCPRLQRINLQGFSALTDAALHEFILARADPQLGGVTPLSRIRASFNREIQVNIVPSLQPLLAAGLSLSVQYQAPQYGLFGTASGFVRFGT
ncbi:hypothetical protein C8J57DRAFT_1659532 [Mycena rebaudengoi]|nr:hypothetical protein C8J57DRAFT_1659532 [Mycena rebaudengoi]